jgi:drug/metabolite transporter (DMT)-like permease
VFILGELPALVEILGSFFIVCGVMLASGLL